MAEGGVYLMGRNGNEIYLKKQVQFKAASRFPSESSFDTHSSRQV